MLSSQRRGRSLRRASPLFKTPKLGEHDNPTESKPVSFVPKWKHNLFYDAASPRSVLYTDSASPEKIDEVSDYFNRRFNTTGKFSLHARRASGRWKRMSYAVSKIWCRAMRPCR